MAIFLVVKLTFFIFKIEPGLIMINISLEVMQDMLDKITSPT